MISQNYFTFPFYVPRICRLWRNWPRFLHNYVLRRDTPSEYQMRNGVRLVGGSRTLAGTIVVVFIRREYGRIEGFKTIVDIGANIGIFAVYAAQSSPDAQIYCYEPELFNFDTLRRNISINGFDHRISAFQCAVASAAGPRDLSVAESLSNSFHMVADGARLETVPCTTLQHILESQRLDGIDLLKMNCEGAEYEILEGCSSADFARIKNIRLEYHNLDAPRRNGESLSRFLRGQGYRIERFSRYLTTSGFIWAARGLGCSKLLLLLCLPECLPAS
jgi:FkbM family methyltransferase